MLDIYVHQIVLVLITVKHAKQLVGQRKSQMKKYFFCAGKGSKHLTFCTVHNMLTRQMFMQYC